MRIFPKLLNFFPFSFGSCKTTSKNCVVRAKDNDVGDASTAYADSYMDESVENNRSCRF
jgi:hypothetical protein